ncbi:MAG: C1 family peptidase, partial [Bacteroidaceae bacterium]|nr:C1 family peptidase [Bacteroidaceae bacterium]
LCINGTITKNSPDYVVRVILIDANDHEYAVLEAFNEINSSASTTLVNYCEETSLLGNIEPKAIKVYIKDASFQFNNIILSMPSTSTRTIENSLFQSQKDSIIKLQKQNIVDRINSYNTAHQKLWRAAITPTCLKSYEVKKRILGLKSQETTGGFEYYGGGIFETSSSGLNPATNIHNTKSKFVDHFDWRNRHGRNWISPVKNQGKSGYCAIFTAVACLEARINLYYNQILNMNLSEQQIASCAALGYPNAYKNGTSLYYVMHYMCNNCIYDSFSYPFVDAPDQICKCNQIIPQEWAIPAGFTPINFIAPSDQEMTDSSVFNLKKELIHSGPISVTVKYLGHGMLLVGYGTIKAGDSIHCSNQHDGLIYIPENDKRIGMTYWIFKNSYGTSYNDYSEDNGFTKILCYNKTDFGDIYEFSAHNYYDDGYIHPPVDTIPLIKTKSHTINDIVCEDRDGDGYYFWGIGPKPASLPAGVPDEPDGDDSNPFLGPMNTFGFMKLNVGVNNVATIYISTNVQTTKPQKIYHHTVVQNGGTWTIMHNLDLYGGMKVTVKSGGTLIIKNGAALNNVNLILESGSHVQILENGKINYSKQSDAFIGNGLHVEMPYGKIRKNY